MAAASSYMVSPMVGWREPKGHSKPTTRNRVPISAQANEAAEQLKVGENEQAPPPPPPPLRPVEVQQNVKSKNMSREYGGQWLSSVTRHVRIYAAYIDPITCEFDQTQMDKLTLILDPSNEFLWNPQTCNKVYAYFQELVDHYEVLFVFVFVFFLLSLLNLIILVGFESGLNSGLKLLMRDSRRWIRCG